MENEEDAAIPEMNINDWVISTKLESPVTEHALLLLARDEETVHLLGTAVFVSPGLAFTAKHVIEESWRIYGLSDVPMERKGGQTAYFKILAVQYPGNRSVAAIWKGKGVWATPFSDLAAISLDPADDLAKAYVFPTMPALSVLHPSKGELVSAFGYASSSVSSMQGNQLNLSLTPLTASGRVTDVYPQRRDKGTLSFPSFQVEALFIGGMSGGPIYNSAGDLCGLVCYGPDDEPRAYGVTLWPILGVMISHEGYGLTCKAQYQLANLAAYGLLELKGYDKVANNVEIEEDPMGKGWIRLRSYPDGETVG